ncbi:MAG: electron transport complex subunit RsxC [Tannerellaceae bacterium]|jgi:electron transport complex protein RnfC|nr:electron transport complex subunit RsxC [Tannerellaceae bacterium]
MLKTFRIGGIHPCENKFSAGGQIRQAMLPERAVIFLAQHLGVPAEAVVKKGDMVKVGTLIGKSAGFISANIHSSVSGKVARVEAMPDMSGYRRPAIVVDVEGDEWEPTVDCSEELTVHTDLDAKDIIKRIADAGIVGMGGATFPTHVKLSPPPGLKAEIIIINAAECEPYLTSDHSLILEKSKEVIVGTALLMKAVGVTKAVVGIENNKKDAIEALRKVKTEGIEILPLKARYPQGGEKQLIDAVMRRQIQSGALPVSVGAIVQNVGTAFAVYEAVMKNKPLIERIVTVTGRGVVQPSIFRARIGTSVQSLIEDAGGFVGNQGKVIAGGPMMGKALSSTEVPVVKGTSGILLLPQEESYRRKSNNCIRCAKCVQACPMGLNPTLLMMATEFGNWQLAEDNYIIDCIDCGSCSYTCPSFRPLLDSIRLGKDKVGTLIRARK